MMTVDDRLVDGAGKPIESVPHMGISAYNIGKQVGEGIAAEIKKRGWDMKDVGAIDVTYEQLPTAHDRTTGADRRADRRRLPEGEHHHGAAGEDRHGKRVQRRQHRAHEEPAVQALGGVRAERRSRARRRARGGRPRLQGGQHDRRRHRRFGFGVERVQEAEPDRLLRHRHHQPEAPRRGNVGR